MQPPLTTAASPVVRTVDSVNPATNQVVERFAPFNPAKLPRIFSGARAAQRDWAEAPLKQRCAVIAHLRDAVYELREQIAATISRETGKPLVEAIFAEILVVLDTADFLSRRAGRWLKRERVGHHNLAMKAKSAWY